MSRKSVMRSDRSKRKNLNIHQTKSQTFDEQALPFKQSSQWYEQKCQKNISFLPSQIPILKNTQPYRLILQKITNLTPLRKNSYAYLHIMITFLTSDLQTLGQTCFYQSDYPINVDGKWDEPICLYYHSRIDRNYGGVKLVLRFYLKQFYQGVLEGVNFVGIGVVNMPFVQEQIKAAPVYRQCAQLQLIGDLVQRLNPSNVTFSYTIQSKLQLKNILKLIPSETVVSPHNHISGIYTGYLPQSRQQPVEQQQIVFINFKLCQIHITDKFEEQVLATIRNLRNDSKNQVVTQRKVICAYHNQYQMVQPIVRVLDMIGKEGTGEYTVLVYEALGDNQILKVPYYTPDNHGASSCALAISLVYTLAGVDYQVAIFAFTPVLTGTVEQLSVTMITGAGQGFVSSLVPLKSTKNPTIIIEYVSEEQIRTRNRMDENNDQMMTRSRKVIKQSAKVLEELQRERLNLEKQKQQLQVLKTQNYISYQDDFQKKLQEERQQLRIRQEMIENQYRQEVQKEFKQKMELQNQIRMMRQRIAALQQGQRSQIPSKKMSYNQSPQVQTDQNFADSFNSNFLMPRQKVNPNYLIQQEKTIPVNEVRQLMMKKFQQNRDVIEKQLKMFNMASKFTFHFSSIVWSPAITPPKSFYMLIKFFNFRQFTSDPLTYIDSGYQYHQLIRLHHYTYSQQNSAPVYEFLVDPSQYANPQIIQQDLVNFLAKNNTIIDIFDAQNYLYIGQINIKMSQLFRGTKSQVMIAKEFNLVKMRSQENYGVVQVLIKNQMAECKDEIDLVQKRTKKQLKKKVVSNNPIVLTKQVFDFEQTVSQVGSKQQAKNRQEKRIQVFKKKAAESKRKHNFDQIQTNQKGLVIQKINEYKQKKMPQFIKKVYEELLTDKITINPYFGQTKNFLYQFTNISQSPSSFRVSFQGNQNELSLVKDPSQWKYYVSQNRYPNPKIYDSINDENSFYLSSGETIPLVFKYISFNKQEQDSKKSMTVTITKEENNWIVGGFGLNIQSHESIINHSYVLYQPGNQNVQLIIPVIFSSNDTRTPKRLFLTIEDATAQWVSQYEVMLRVRTPHIMNMLKFNMLLYEDDYFCLLKQNWLIELYAYEGVYAVAKQDEKTRFKISVPFEVVMETKPNWLQFYASNSDLVFETQRLEGSKLARGACEIWCQLLPSKSSLGSIQITCVNEKKQLVYGWILQVYPYSAKNY